MIHADADGCFVGATESNEVRKSLADSLGCGGVVAGIDTYLIGNQSRSIGYIRTKMYVCHQGHGVSLTK